MTCLHQIDFFFRYNGQAATFSPPMMLLPLLSLPLEFPCLPGRGRLTRSMCGALSKWVSVQRSFS